MLNKPNKHTIYQLIKIIYHKKSDIGLVKHIYCFEIQLIAGLLGRTSRPLITSDQEIWQARNGFSASTGFEEHAHCYKTDAVDEYHKIKALNYKENILHICLYT